MFHTTGFTYDELSDICVLLTSAQREPGAATWPPCLGLFNSVVATLAYLRQNRTQSDIGDSLGVPEVQYIVDGTLLPCWSWSGHKELYSGKHVCHERWRSLES
jgi:hypothetical protein